MLRQWREDSYANWMLVRARVPLRDVRMATLAAVHRRAGQRANLRSLDVCNRPVRDVGRVERISNLDAGVTDTASDIRAAKAHLAELRRRFTDKHPDVILTQRDLEDLMKRQQEESATVRAKNPTGIAESGLALAQLTHAEA